MNCINCPDWVPIRGFSLLSKGVCGHIGNSMYSEKTLPTIGCDRYIASSKTRYGRALTRRNKINVYRISYYVTMFRTHNINAVSMVPEQTPNK